MRNDNVQYVNHMQKKLKFIAFREFQHKDFETSLEAIASFADLSYRWNQSYTDDGIEKLLSDIQNSVLKKAFNICEANHNTVVLYDGFGYDTRGLVLIYLLNLLDLGYHVVYITGEHVKDKQPELKRQVLGKNITFEYVPIYEKYMIQIEILNNLFLKYKPRYAFLITVPYDVSGIVVFNNYEKIVERYLVNLTDHAFWIGKNSFDYCLEFRDYGACISKFYRKIDEQNIIKLPYYPYYNVDMPFQGFPFDFDGKKVIFSGGALYKTFGDKDIYYEIVEKLLAYRDDTLFLYAGFGDDSKLKKLKKIFPNRVYYIAERKDLFQIMQNIYFYLNTYPMLGGLMTQYAVVAGKVPLTLVHNSDSDGILFNQNELPFFYQNYEMLIQDAYKMLDDVEYLRKYENLARKSIISKQDFRNELKRILSNHCSQYEIKYSRINTEAFRKEYIFAFDKKNYKRSFAQKRRLNLGKYFPTYFVYGYFDKFKSKF